jgi:alkylation response protein AidB-like acyl-CoA dehydrogenase
LITNQLNHERVTLCSSGIMERSLDDTRRWAQQTVLADGTRVIDQPWVQQNLAWVHANLEVLRLLNWQVAWHAERGDALDPAAASTVKVHGTEFYMEGLRRLLEVVNTCASVRDGSPDVVLKGRLATLLRGLHVLTFGGGTNELQRDLIALFGLNMPPSPR